MNSKPENHHPDPEKANASDSQSQQPVSAAASSLPDGRRAETAAALIPLGESPAAELVSEKSTPMELVAWGLKHFADRKKIITTSFGMEGCTLIDMCSKAIAADNSDQSTKLTVAWIDTGFLLSRNTCRSRKTRSQIRQHRIRSLVHRRQRRTTGRKVRQRTVEE